MIYGYARVSTVGQSIRGTSLDAQEQQLKDKGANVVYKEAYTGTKMDRPAWDKLLSVVKYGDTIMVCKLDRFARNTTEGIKMIDSLNKRGISVWVLNMGVLDDTPTGKLIRNVMLAFAEFERDMIVERTSSGRAIAMENGVRFGRPEKDIDRALESARNLVANGMSIQKACKVAGITRSDWYNRKYAESRRAVG